MLDDVPLVHHHDPVGEHIHNRQVMRDEQAGEANLYLQCLEQFEHFRLYGHIERARRLICYE